MTHGINMPVLFTLLLYLLSATTFAREKLYIFYPSVLDHKSLQDSIAGEMKGISVTVFGRYDSFIEKTENNPPNGLITKKILVEKQLTDYTISLTGEKNGKTTSRYIILSTDKKPDIESFDNKTVIGVTDILGRKDMKLFLSEFFPSLPKIKRVPKVADLLSMLSFEAASGIMVEEVFLDYFKSTSQLSFFSCQLPETLNGSLVFAERKNAKKTLTILKKNKKTICDLLYIDQWK